MARPAYREGKTFGDMTTGSGSSTILFQTTKPGIVTAVDVLISGSLKSASSYTFTNLTGSSMGAQSADDFDTALDAILGVMTLDIGKGRKPIVGLLPSFCRGTLAYFNQKDYDATGAMANGAALTSSYAAFTARIRIPLGLGALCEDLESCKQGSAIFRKGYFTAAGFSGANPTFTSQSGSITCTLENVVVEVQPISENGAAGYVGPYWDIQNRPGLNPNGPPIGEGFRLLLGYTTTTDSPTITIAGPVNVEQLPKAFFQNQYSSDWVVSTTAPAVQNRLFPLMYLRPGCTIDDLDPRGVAPYILAQSVSALPLVDVILHQDKSAAGSEAASELGGNQGVSVQLATPSSHSTTGKTPLRKSGFAGAVITPGKMTDAAGKLAPGIEFHANPSSLLTSSVLLKKLA